MCDKRVPVIKVSQGDIVFVEIYKEFFDVDSVTLKRLKQRAEVFFNMSDSDYTFTSYNIAEDKVEYLRFTEEYLKLEDKVMIQSYVLRILSEDSAE